MTSSFRSQNGISVASGVLKGTEVSVGSGGGRVGGGISWVEVDSVVVERDGRMASRALHATPTRLKVAITMAIPHIRFSFIDPSWGVGGIVSPL
jgi:hypothetical protein